MKLTCFIITICCWTTLAYSQEPSPTARQILNTVIYQLPRKPIDINGGITVRKRRGVIVKEMDFKMALDWGGVPSKAVYSIMDTSGSQLEELTVTRGKSQPPDYKYVSGQSGSAEIPDLYKAVQATDMSWMDLTLSFLWWKDATITGEDTVRGQDCYLIDVTSTEGDAALYSKVRLWIDKKMFVLLQAEGYDRKDQPIRRLWIKSFKKINDIWMIKDMEVESYPVRHRTKIHIRTVNTGKQL